MEKQGHGQKKGTYGQMTTMSRRTDKVIAKRRVILGAKNKYESIDRQGHSQKKSYPRSKEQP